MDKPVTAHLQFVLKQTTISIEVCTRARRTYLAQSDLQTDLETATTKKDYAITTKEVLTRFKDASVKSLSFDFKSMSSFNLSFDSSSFALRTLLRLIPNYRAEYFNTEDIIKKQFVEMITRRAPKLLNYLIDDTR
ncbi:hypothetical protein GN244_ATG12827 [Phytophthora infestans]|uniref:Uncharacterized protein n=1 Tax=Phytophthora infestans TaxID=4787 RepID=A0A833WS19_PHYIN|nr:hypothetical protein GN244_ATG12827 [Phytophthora infestans]KAF4134779.1 hypothetical protein GN958_ATG16035 [Phytophthora infestans]